MRLYKKNSKELFGENISSKLFYIFLLAAFCYLFYFFSTADLERVLTVIPDDAPYFFKTAENVVAGRGFTFDGINKTNGFQPLWLYVLLPVYAVYHGPPEALLRVTMILQLILLSFSAVIIYSMVSRAFSRRVGLISGLLFFIFVFFRAANGMESALLILMLAVLFAYGWTGKIFVQPHTGRQFLFGIFLGLVMLSRLDMAFLAFALFVFLCIKLITRRETRKTDFRRLLMILAGFLIMVGPYLAYNYLEFSSIMPISGALKSSFPRISLSGYALSKIGKNILIVFAAFSYLLWFILGINKSTAYKPDLLYFRISMAVMSAAVLLHFLHTILFMKWAIFNWHFITYVFFGSVVISEPAFHILSFNPIKKYKIFYWVGIPVLVLYGSLKIYNRYQSPREGGFRVESYRAAVWARENTDKEDVFAMKDAGNFGFFSQSSVINLDGIVNNIEYQKALKDRKLNQYLETKGVKYLAQHAFRNRRDITSGDYETFSIAYYSHKYMMRSEKILLKKENEVYRSDPYYDGPYRTVFIIWKLSGFD